MKTYSGLLRHALDSESTPSVLLNYNLVKGFPIPTLFDCTHAFRSVCNEVFSRLGGSEPLSRFPLSGYSWELSTAISTHTYDTGWHSLPDTFSFELSGDKEPLDYPYTISTFDREEVCDAVSEFARIPNATLSICRPQTVATGRLFASFRIVEAPRHRNLVASFSSTNVDVVQELPYRVMAYALLCHLIAHEINRSALAFVRAGALIYSISQLGLAHPSIAERLLHYDPRPASQLSLTGACKIDSYMPQGLSTVHLSAYAPHCSVDIHDTYVSL